MFYVFLCYHLELALGATLPGDKAGCESSSVTAEGELAGQMCSVLLLLEDDF